MKISNLQQYDEGRYTCEYRSFKTYFNLRIKVPLTAVIINTQSVTVIEGRTIDVKCTTSDSVPAANVTWYILRQGSLPVQITSGIANLQENKTTIGTLTYTGHKQDNDGILYCNATQDTIQIKSQNVPISVFYKPSNIRIFPVFDPYIVYVTQTGIHLHCSADVGNPSFITYTWSHNGVDASNNPFVITVTKNSGGNYTCTAGNTAGTIATHKMITVQYGPEIQRFTKQQPVEGSRFVLSCYVSGKPAPTSQQIWWSRQNDNTFRRQGNKLVIDNIQKEQSGTYKCHAQNTLTPSGQGSINKTATRDGEVDVLYKPVLLTSPNFNPLILYVGQQNVQMTCSSSQANPSSVDFWWTYNKQNYNGPVYNLQTVTKTSGGVYICNGRNTVGTSSSTVSVVVQYGPTIDPVSPQKFIAGRYATVSCNVNSYPDADVTWTGPNNFYIAGKTLIFNKTTKSRKGIYNCTASNTLTPSGQSNINKQQQIDFDVDILYKPEIMDIPSHSIVEGENLTLTCSTRANPTAHSYKWTKIGDNIFQQLNETLVITNIRRTQSGKYKCTAMNTMSPTNGQTETGEGHGEVTISVNYPPAVTVAVQNTTENATNVVFTCNAADGFPTNYTYHGWNQYIGNARVRSYTDFSGMLSESNRKLTIPRVTFEDTGRYYCYVKNGFHGTTLHVFQQGSSYFDVRVSAKVDPDEEASRLGELHKSVTINIKFYSNPPAGIKDIKWISQTSGNVLNNSDNISLNLISTVIQRIIYGKTVTLAGQSAILTIASLQSFHFGHYQLQIENGGNLSSTYNFQIIQLVPPEAPNKFTVRENKTNSVVLVWERGFNGGYPQTFVIQYTNTVTGQTNETKIGEKHQASIYTTEITGLTSETTYLFWIYSFNSRGNSSFSYKPIIAKTLKESKATRESTTTTVAIGGAIGSILALMVILGIPIVFILYRRRTNGCKKNGDSHDDGQANNTYADIDLAMSEVSPYLEVRNLDNASTLHDTDINTYEALDDKKQESGANTYETLTHKHLNEDKMTTIYVNTAIRDRINNKEKNQESNSSN